MKFLAAFCFLALAACGSTTTSTPTTTGLATSTTGRPTTATNGAGASSASTSVSGSGTGPSSSTATSATSATTSSPVTSAGASNGSGSGGGSTSANCVADGQYSSDPTLCCSGVATDNYCGAASATGTTATSGTNTGGTTATTTGSGTTGTGGQTFTTFGGTTGTCPSNMPNLIGATTGGQGRGIGPCNTGIESVACPKGYQCIAGECMLNSSSTLQVTLSFDDIEDLDLHLVEPIPADGGSCEIYYGNPGVDPDAGSINIPCIGGLFGDCDGGALGGTIGGTIGGALGGGGCPAGWLDRDTNAACGGESGNGNNGPDGVNVENILFANGEPVPVGTYTIRVDYWENCDQTVCSDGMDDNACNGYPTSNIAVQVRKPDGTVESVCLVVDASSADSGGKGSGQLIGHFTIQ